MAMNVGNYSQFYKGTEQLKQYGSGTGGKDTIVRYEFNTKDAQGNKVMDQMSREETLQVMKDISSQYGDNVIVEFSGDGLAKLVEEGKPYSHRQLSEEEAAARAERQERFNDDVVQMEGTHKVVNGMPEHNLSQKAKKLLDKLRKQYGNMDFFVSDKNSDMKSMLKNSSKEFSVIFSSEELEKMAEDEDYARKQMDRVNQAVRMSKEINQRYGFTSAYGKNAGQAEITKIGIAVGDDGTMTFFAELEKSSAKQREYMERNRDKRAEDKKAAEKKAAEKEKDKRRNEKAESDTRIVEASSIEDLVWKMNRIDWSNPQKGRTGEGNRFDYLV
ncbi:MAG: hypothetical protein K2K96_07690 [Lachnospiraceae bacterium]|nr:hypothetical protein [Lachnospiraceae bacterium]